MKALLLYSTTDGQTRAIASYLASCLKETLPCDVVDLQDAGQLPLAEYGVVVIGASIRYGHFNPALDKFVKQHAEMLNRLPTAFYGVNLTARKPEKRTPQTNPYVRKFLLASPWQPTRSAVFAGALRYPRYRWLDKVMIRFIMKMTGGETDTSKEVEYTDWNDVAAFAQEIARIAGK
ncbi:menaquinone-dependent protoporphyrinogen IX dehydrogenase [Nissabacter sp. SGAir0207]|uniref:menaquinone-dependent protoporphyrinogen IX dehydrogenase n=1 Tax=Nissabacter sp. SGAir0207 TaxID=2126321 RepID=UPI0010CCF23F|nr:menaquinone-dependent protoporphyrinogen IX dehydrogenase [Nissabacter sp. SGAir0207]QCR37488.1 menaquinone-dependent protoporphyrinogen IX dehydrogenase [Nissabacter sp. SGAir0207]